MNVRSGRMVKTSGARTAYTESLISGHHALGAATTTSLLSPWGRPFSQAELEKVTVARTEKKRAFFMAGTFPKVAQRGEVAGLPAR
jgi:hypothetical protein